MATPRKTRPSSVKVASRARGKAAVKAPLVRGEVVVQRVLDAALVELAQVGYQGFRVEEVAARAQVNKTTVYRRWPTKQDLVRDALTRRGAPEIAVQSTGSLRGDLLLLGRTYVEMASRPIGRSVVRMLMAESFDPEVAGLVRALRDSTVEVPKALIAAAVERGELAPGFDPGVLTYAVAGALQHRIFFMHEDADEVFLTSLVDLLLCGALRPGPRAA
jgi:AcrR family transcriptional regulator